MGGSHNIGDDWELASGSTATSTLVLVGKSGTGKSATGNSILGRKAFKSYNHRDGVTTTCEMQSTILNDGRTVNVIDTPGLFDLRHGSEFVGKEIVRCMDLAKDGIHAILVVFSARTRFSPAEEASIKSLQTLFGDKITDHVIVVFTGGDDFEDDGTSLKDYLSRPEQGSDSLQEFIRLCKYRVVLFDNRTKDVAKQTDQIHELFSHVDSIVAANDGQPYSDQVIAELKEGSLRTQDKVTEIESLKKSKGYTEEHISDLKNQIYKSYDDQLVRITAMVEQKLQASVERLEKQLTHVANKGDLLTLLHVVAPAEHHRRDETPMLASSLGALCKACKPEVEVEALVIQGPKLTTVLSQVRKLEASVLVLSQRSPSPLCCLFMSSHEEFVEQCINKADCLTLAVRKQSKGVGGYLISTRWQKNFWLLA